MMKKQKGTTLTMRQEGLAWNGDSSWGGERTSEEVVIRRWRDEV